jgi:thiol-disulfide isomerase/thioredoxin
MARTILVLILLIAGGLLLARAAEQKAAPVSAEMGPAGTQPAPSPMPAALPDYGAAPELKNTVWLNTEAPLRLANLRGKVVLLEMWTFSCINCQHVTPSLKQWYQDYSASGLVIIGNHFPEFPYEADLGNLKKAVAEQGIRYPIAQDNDAATWDAYHNRYWPTLYLIDRAGHIRYKRIGEGGYAETESAIQALLSEAEPQN